MTGSVNGQYKDLYDQAGLMLRVDEMHWLKCGIEFFEGRQHASAVVTHEYSDWSVVPLHPARPSLWLRVTYKDATIEVHYSLDGTSYYLLRQAYLTTTESIDVGMFCASPTGPGFTVTFDDFAVQNI